MSNLLLPTLSLDDLPPFQLPPRAPDSPSPSMESPDLKPFILLIVFLMHLLMSHHIEAAEYIVGDDDGWTQAVNYQSWSEQHTFYAGDDLVFNYVPGQHNTYEVNEDTYRTCNTSQGVIATYYSGHDQVTLNETGDHWFLCNIQDHCKGGMKFGVRVEAIMNTSQTSGSMGFTPISINGGWRWVWTFDLVPLVGLFMLNY